MAFHDEFLLLAGIHHFQASEVDRFLSQEVSLSIWKNDTCLTYNSYDWHMNEIWLTYVWHIIDYMIDLHWTCWFFSWWSPPHAPQEKDMTSTLASSASTPRPPRYQVCTGRSDPSVADRGTLKYVRNPHDIHIYIYVSIYISISITLSLYFYIIPLYLSMSLSIHASIHLSFHLSSYPSIHLSLAPSLPPSIHPSIHLMMVNKMPVYLTFQWKFMWFEGTFQLENALENTSISIDVLELLLNRTASNYQWT